MGTTALSINQGVGTVSTTSPLVKPTTTTTYTLTATNPGGTRTATCTVTLLPAPTITSFTATPATINRGQSVALNWATSGEGVSLALNNGIGTVTGTSTTVQPEATTTFTLTATNPSGAVSSTSTTIVVNQPPAIGTFTIPSVAQGQAVNCVLPIATDPESDAISDYAVAGLPTGLSFDPATRTLTGALAAPGAYRFLYCAIDAKGAMGSRMLDLDVLATGVAPSAGSTMGVDYTYDNDGRLASMTYPSGRVVAYTYDALDRVTQVTQNGQPVVQQIDYDAWSNRTQQINASGAIDQWTYDTPGLRVTQWAIGTVGGIPEARSYTYDAADRLTKAGEWGTLSYDANSRLTRATATAFGVDNELAHDAFNNNIKSASNGTLPESMVKFEFNPMVDNHLPGQTTNGGLTQISETNFGEIMNLGTGVSSTNALSMTWDDLGRMTSTTLAGATESYRYAASGLRVSRTDNQNPALSRLYAYTGSGQLLGEYTLNVEGNPVWARDVIYLGNQAVAEINASGTHELHSDHLGSPRMITNAAGTVEGTQAYGPYGELLQQTGYIPLTGYTGHLQTEPTGLIYMRGRFYSPAWHRFMNSDQGVDPDGINQFCYVSGNPLMDTDPSGMVTIKDEPNERLTGSDLEARKAAEKRASDTNEQNRKEAKAKEMTEQLQKTIKLINKRYHGAIQLTQEEFDALIVDSLNLDSPIDPLKLATRCASWQGFVSKVLQSAWEVKESFPLTGTKLGTINSLLQMRNDEIQQQISQWEKELEKIGFSGSIGGRRNGPCDYSGDLYSGHVMPSNDTCPNRAFYF